MRFRLQWLPSRDGLHLISEPYLGYLEHGLTMASRTVYPRLYFSYNAMTQQTTIMTTDMNKPHLCMIQHLKELSGMSVQPEISRLLIQCFVVARECFRAVVEQWDERASGPVCRGRHHLPLCLRLLPIASNTLDSGGDHHAQVQAAEVVATVADMIRGDFMAFQSALTSLEESLQDLYRILSLDPAVKESLGALFMELRRKCEVPGLLFDSVVTRYDRFLNLVSYLHPSSNGC